MIILDLLFNLTLLIALSIVSGFIGKRCPSQTPRGRILQGLLFGGAAVIGMLRPLDLGAGLIFDGRSVMVSVCALYFGPVAGVISAAMAIVARIALAGTGMITGVLVILSAVGIGIIAHQRFIDRTNPPSTENLCLFGLVVHLVMLALMFTLPESLGLQVVTRIGPTVLLLYPLATILIGKLLSDQLNADRTLAGLQQSESLFRSLFENHSAVKLIIDPENGDIVDANPAAENYYGWSIEQLKRMKIFDFNTLPAEATALEIEKARRQGKVRFEFQHRRADGSIRDIAAFSSKIVLKGKDFLHAIVYDVTDKKETEKVLILRTKELERRNAELEQFNYTMSHDIRTPLVTIEAFLGFLQQDIAHQNEDGITGDIAHIRSATQRMSQLLDSLQQLFCVGGVKHPPILLSYRSTVKETLNHLADPINDRNVEICLTGADLLLYADRSSLCLLWQILIENAVKYMGEQQEPVIEVGTEQREQETLFFVRDNGMGIDSSYHQKIFRLFDKVDQHSGGSGLGLTLARRIVEFYGGVIWIESAGVGQGSCFYFTLPDAYVDAKADKRGRCQLQALSDPRTP